MSNVWWREKDVGDLGAEEHFTYKVIAGHKGGGLQHVQTGRAVAGGTVELSAAALTDVTGGIGNLPTVDKHHWILACIYSGAVWQCQVVCWVPVAKTWAEDQLPVKVTGLN